jgi:methoxymalonate biosynthesis acyl carrier protein
METGTAMTAQVRGELRSFITENFLYMRPELELRDDDDLLRLGVIDSLGFVELVEEVQARYGVAVQDVEITEDNFGSVDALVTFIERKRRS